MDIFNQKKSREESKGADSGVEILVNEPYEGGPGGDGNTGGGQYTRKIYHVGSHLPGNITQKKQFIIQIQVKSILVNNYIMNYLQVGLKDYYQNQHYLLKKKRGMHIHTQKLDILAHLQKNFHQKLKPIIIPIMELMIMFSKCLKVKFEMFLLVCII